MVAINIQTIKRFFVMSVCSLSLAACGGAHKPIHPASPLEAGTSTGSAPSYEQIQPILQQRCSRCHGSGALNWMDKGTFTAEAKKGSVHTMISSKAMPKPGSPESSSITDDERAKIIAFADGVSGAGKGGGGTSDDVGIVRDKGLALVSRCMTCHGQYGISGSPEIPNLAGHDPAYIKTRLLGFLTATEGQMPAILKGFVDEFKIDVSKADADHVPELFSYAAGFFGSYTMTVSAGDLQAEREKFSENDKQLYEKGGKVFADNSCAACHVQTNLRPMESTPMIMAQKLDYLHMRFDQFKRGVSGSTMPGIVEPLSKDDITAVAFYVNHTAPSEVKQPQ